MRINQTLAFLALVALPATAHAEDRTPGWIAWTDHAIRIQKALQSADSATLDATCKGVSKTVNPGSYVMPRWALSLVDTCTFTQAAFHGDKHNNRRVVVICKNLKSVAKALDKAQPVAEDPRAHVVAHALASSVREVHAAACPKGM
jgi:hypothetical protein